MTAAEDFDALVATRGSALLRVAVFLRPHDAEDLLQAALVTTWRHWSPLRDASSPVAEAYTRTTMHRLAARWSRRWWHRETPTEVLPNEPFGAATEPDQRLDLQRALATLPPRWRLILVLRCAEDLTEADVAHLMHCPVGTVKSSTSRALQRLRTVPGLDTYLTEQEGSRR